MDKVILGMSGGVDSTVAAYLLKEKGYEVIGATMMVDPDSCFLCKDIEDAKIICEKLHIKHIVKDVSKDFKNIIKDRFVNDYVNGLTPPPCSICNSKIKFRFLYNIMIEENAKYISTGHYAKVNSINIEGTKTNSKRYNIIKSDNIKKDQSYMLYGLDQDVLSHLLLPIGDMDKNEVRDLAKKLDLDISDKKDSEDICFIKEIENEMKGNTDKPYVEYIKRYYLNKNYKEKVASGELNKNKIEEICPFLKKGEIIENGKVVAYHDGIINYTIGQRRGFNIGFGKKKYVVDINSNNNQIIIGDDKNLYSNIIKIESKDTDTIYQALDYNNIKNINIDTYVKIRYRDKYNKCKININNNYINIESIDPIRAITKGQVAVVYDKYGNILFGGIIKNVV